SSLRVRFDGGSEHRIHVPGGPREDVDVGVGDGHSLPFAQRRLELRLIRAPSPQQVAFRGYDDAQDDDDIRRAYGHSRPNEPANGGGDLSEGYEGEEPEAGRAMHHPSPHSETERNRRENAATRGESTTREPWREGSRLVGREGVHSLRTALHSRCIASISRQGQATSHTKPHEVPRVSPSSGPGA